jgi:Mg-chelatase subunit ChlD
MGPRIRRRLALPLLLIAVSGAGAAPAAPPELRVEIHQPAPDAIVPASQQTVEVVGGASIYGGVRYLDLFLVMDTSKSLRSTDPKDHRSSGAVGLVRSLPAGSDIRIGVVDFDGNTDLLSPLTDDRDAVVAALQRLDRSGSTDIAEGITTALRGFEESRRPGASRVILLFTDGKSDAEEARRALEAARRQGVAIHALLLGSDDEGESILREIAGGTNGSFVRVTDPATLPQAFLDLRTTGVESVVLRPAGGAPIPARLSGGTFRAEVPVQMGQNRIVATAVSKTGEIRQAEVSVRVRGPGCAELQVEAVRGGRPALSISDRATLLVFDASNSMWGRMEGRPKISVAQEILADALGWIPDDLMLGLRAYGNRHPHAQKNCRDSELLVPFQPQGRDEIRSAIAGFRPSGQTPLAYALEQVAGDFGDFRGERAVVLVTDGIESCGGDPAAAARALQANGPLPVHVIGFGLGEGADEDPESLRAIAEASGGRFLTARSAAELREALAVTVGTPFLVRRDSETVARGTLGARDVIPLPEGEYTVRLESRPPYEVPVVLHPEQGLTLRLERDGSKVMLAREEREIDHRSCEPAESSEPWQELSPLPAAPAP